jgi:hypothetical protein
MQDEQLNQGSDFERQDFQGAHGGDGGQGIESARGVIKDKARQAKERVLTKGSEAIHAAREKTRNVAVDRKNQLGVRIHGYGSAFRRAADKLRDEKDPNIAHYAESLAERIDQAADYVQSRDPGMILRDVENAARRRPEIFFGGMFLAGLVLARFLKASNQRDDVYQDETDDEYWVEESYDESPEEMTSADPNFAMTSGEAAGDWKQPGGTL